MLNSAWAAAKSRHIPDLLTGLRIQGKDPAGGDAVDPAIGDRHAIRPIVRRVVMVRPEHLASRIPHGDDIRRAVLQIGDAVGNHRIGDVRAVGAVALQRERPGNSQLRHVCRRNSRVRDAGVVQVTIGRGPLVREADILHGAPGGTDGATPARSGAQLAGQ